jgi:ethanolamine utilization protein EutQ
VDWDDLGVGGDQAEIRAVVGPESSTSIGAGFCRFSNCRFDWELGYDEVIHVIEGEIAVIRGDQVLRGGPGDVLFLPRGSRVTYAIASSCLLFYAAYPVDWQERMESAHA